MKNALKLIALALLSFGVATCDNSSSNSGDNNNNTNMVVLEGNLSTQTLRANQKYLLRGQVFVREGQVLTIEPGTVIFGDKRTRATLIIDKGGQIMAEGTAKNSIVFTSAQEAGVRDRGDWGGLVIVGRANVNLPSPNVEGIQPALTFGTSFSTQFDNESSGVLKYVRVEFGGIELLPNNETNSITLCGVGRGTTMDYAMVSFGGDDGFEWFGGTINSKYLISFAMWDDDFDVDYGFNGNVQFGLVVRYPGYADQSGSNGFECDNNNNDRDNRVIGEDGQPLAEPRAQYSYTTGTFSNFTVIGPIKEGSTISNGNYQHAIDLRRRVAVSIYNSVFTGFPRGIRFNQNSVYDQYTTDNRGQLANNILVVAGNSNDFLSGQAPTTGDQVKTYWEADNSVVTGISDANHTTLGLNTNIFYGSRLADNYGTPTLAVTSGTLASGARFDYSKFSETNRTGFFEQVAFRGAFGATNWASGWAEFDPVNKEY